MFGPLVKDVLERVLELRLSFLISGATGSGKTTLLSTLLGLCAPEERLVLIEDASELNRSIRMWSPSNPGTETLKAAVKWGSASSSGRPCA
jgi:Flp pilus assembly CpaF family ATPase